MKTHELLLVKLMEECNEVSQRCSKALRFGLNEIQTGQDLNNAERIEEEIAGLFAAFNELSSLTNVGRPSLNAIHQAELKARKYMEYSRSLGTLTDS